MQVVYGILSSSLVMAIIMLIPSCHVCHGKPTTWSSFTSTHNPYSSLTIATTRTQSTVNRYKRCFRRRGGASLSSSSPPSEPKYQRKDDSLFSNIIFPRSSSSKSASDDRNENEDESLQQQLNSSSERPISKSKQFQRHHHLHRHPWLDPLLKMISSPRKSLQRLQNSKVSDSLLSAFRFGLVAYLIFEGFQVIREICQELSEEFNTLDSGSSPPPGAVLSPTEAKKLVAWLDTSHRNNNNGSPPPPSISPIWMIGVAQDLKTHGHDLTNAELVRILSSLTKSQATLLQSCLLRSSSSQSGGVDFSFIGGLSNIKEFVRDWIMSYKHHNHYDDYKIKSPYDKLIHGHNGRQGIVLWGPPGCGKSLLIQAMAKKSGLPTLVITPSLMQRKWYGESTNQVKSLFGLTSCLGRCIVVLDELDGLFRCRNSQDEHEVSRELKTEWLQWWDGVASSSSSTLSTKNENNNKNNNNAPNRPLVVVVAATNRPWDVDPAVWRRLPQRVYVGTPSYEDRCDLLLTWTKQYELPPIPSKVINALAHSTDGYIPSDLFQTLQLACRKGPATRNDTELTLEDVEYALESLPPTRFSPQYFYQVNNFFNQNYNVNQMDNHENNNCLRWGISIISISPLTHKSFMFWKTIGRNNKNGNPVMVMMIQSMMMIYTTPMMMIQIGKRVLSTEIKSHKNII